jgi:EmrB/QacA subfamily drug resistance transporter
MNSPALNLYQHKNYKWWAFAAVAIGTMTSVINNGATIVAVPTIAAYFSTDLATVQWVPIAEALTVSALLLPMGRLSDTVGRKRIYIAGLIIFVIAAALAATSSHIVGLIIFKGIQGVGAAMTQGTGMAMVTAVFPPEERGKGIGFQASVVGAGGVIGPVVGGFLVSALGWQWVFYINVIMGSLAMVVTFLIIDSRIFRQDSRRGRYDWLGAALSMATLLAFLLTVTNGSRTGWTSPVIVAGAMAFVILLTAFIWWELRAPSPMLDLTLFKNRVFTLGISAGYISFLGASSVRFLLPFFLQAALGYSPGQVGLILIPNAISRIIMGPLSGRLSDRYGWRTFNVGGMVITACGLFILATISESSSVTLIITGIVIQSSGFAVFQSPNNSSVLGSVEQNRYGVVSALLSLMRNSANVTGVAVATAIVTATMVTMGYVTDIESVVEAGPGTGLVQSFITGLRIAYVIMGCLMLAAAGISAFKSSKGSETLEVAGRPS